MATSRRAHRPGGARVRVVLAVVAVVLTACAPPPVGAPTSSDQPAGVPSDAQSHRVDRVVDGDTVRVFAMDAGDGGSVRVRLLNVDAPELGRDGQPAECLAEEAAARLEALLAGSQWVWLAADRVEQDRFGRPLRAMWTEDGLFVNEWLAAEGLAVAVLFNDNDRFLAPVRRAETEAVAAGRGLHGPDCG